MVNADNDDPIGFDGVKNAVSESGHKCPPDSRGDFPCGFRKPAELLQCDFEKRAEAVAQALFSLIQEVHRLQRIQAC